MNLENQLTFGKVRAVNVFDSQVAICVQKMLSFAHTVSTKMQQWFLPFGEAIASRAVFVIVSGSDGWTDGNAFGAS